MQIIKSSSARRRSRWITVVSVITLFTMSAKGAEIAVTVDFAERGTPLELKSFYEEGETALAVLERVSRVGLRKVGDFLFVASINGIQSQPGKRGWFYQIDGVKAKSMASSMKLKGAKEMHWYLAPQACGE